MESQQKGSFKHFLSTIFILRQVSDVINVGLSSRKRGVVEDDKGEMKSGQ